MSLHQTEPVSTAANRETNITSKFSGSTNIVLLQATLKLITNLIDKVFEIE